MTAPTGPLPDDAALPGQADVTRTSAADDVTLPPSGKSNPLPRQPTKVPERYELAGEVARGGMGAILRAKDLNIKRTVAMKVVLEAAAGDEDALRRFTQEAELTGQLEHPNIVPVHDLSFDEQGRPFYTMKFVKGVTLHEILALLKEGEPAAVAQYSLAALLTIFQKVCDAVAFAHSKGVIHRDLKPANIMVGEYGEVLVMDWGLAKVVGGQQTATDSPESTVPSPESGERSTQRGWAKVSDLAPPATAGLAVAPETCGQKDGAVRDRRQTESRVERPGAGPQLSALNPQHSAGTRPSTLNPQPGLTLAGSIMGSPQYMAPEQAAGDLDKLDARTDIFALGGILYNILTLHPPVSGETVVEMLERIRAGEILPPSSYNTKTGRKTGGTIKVGAKTFPQPPLIPLRHCPGGRIPESLAAVAMKALALRREDRYPSVTELQKDIAAYQGGFATLAEHAGAFRQFALLVKRHKTVAVAVGLLVVMASGFMVKVVHEKNRAEAQRQRAEANEKRAENALASLRETAPTFREQALAEIKEQRLSEALKNIQHAIDLQPAVAEYHYLKGNILQTWLRLENAEAAYRAALERDSRQVLAQENLRLCEKLRAANAGQAEWSRASLLELRAAMVKQGRLNEANVLLAKVGKDIPLMLAACTATVGKNGTVNLIGGDTIKVALNSTVDSLSMLRGLHIDSLVVDHCQVTDLSPLRGMALTKLQYMNSPVSDLSPLQGMPLRDLIVLNTKVSDLESLKGMPLTNLWVSYTDIRDLSPLRGMPLMSLNIAGCKQMADLSPLEGMALERLEISGTSVADLRPLHGMPLRYLHIAGTLVTDLSPLKGMPLEELWFGETAVTDLTPLRGMPLRAMVLSLNVRDLTPLADCRQLERLAFNWWNNRRDIDFLRSFPNLRQIGANMSDQLLPAAEFWKQYDDFWKTHDAKQTNAPAAKLTP